jgi:hypothetical protein
MRYSLLIFFAIFFSLAVDAQIDVFTIVGKKRNEFETRVGLGGFLKFGVPVNQGSDEITAEAAVLIFDGASAGFLPMKLGYVYTFDRSGYGFYFEPQTGYAIGEDYGERANGFVGTANIGYLFKPAGGFRFNIALRSENIFTNLGTYNFLGLKLSHNLSFGRREE